MSIWYRLLSLLGNKKGEVMCKIQEQADKIEKCTDPMLLQEFINEQGELFSKNIWYVSGGEKKTQEEF
jgi:ribosomal protein S18